MKLTVIVDNLCSRPRLLSEWGYAAVLETAEGNLLIDTAEHGATLLHNLHVLGFDPASLSDVFLSHGHFDHCGGLGELLVRAPHVRLWGASHIAVERRGGPDPATAEPEGGGQLLRLAGLHSIDDTAEILPGVTAFVVPQAFRDSAFINQDDMWEVGPDGALRPDTFADDMSLLVRGERGYSLLLGCAHAGLPNILRYAAARFGVTSYYAVVGGMHFTSLSSSELAPRLDALRSFDVRCWRPAHCTGFRAAAGLAARFPDVDWAGAGTEILL